MAGMAQIRQSRGVPAKRGMRVRFTGAGGPQLGTIKSARDGYLRILLDGDKWAGTYHPTWKLEYITEPPEFKSGDTFKRTHPFTRSITQRWNGDECEDVEYWRPGAWGVGDNPPDDCYPYCHAEGTVVFTVRAVVCPGGTYRDRVVYTQKFIDPEGCEAAKRPELRWTTPAVFRGRVKCFPFDYEVDSSADPVRAK